MTYGPDNVTERGKYLNVWQQVNGSWKIKPFAADCRIASSGSRPATPRRRMARILPATDAKQ